MAIGEKAIVSFEVPPCSFVKDRFSAIFLNKPMHMCIHSIISKKGNLFHSIFYIKVSNIKILHSNISNITMFHSICYIQGGEPIKSSQGTIQSTHLDRCSSHLPAQAVQQPQRKRVWHSELRCPPCTTTGWTKVCCAG